MLTDIIKSLREAVKSFDLSDVAPEKPAPVVKKPPPAPLAALKKGLKQPIKNKLPGIYNAPSKDTSSALSVFKKESSTWQTFASLAQEGREIIEGGGSRASKVDRQRAAHPLASGERMTKDLWQNGHSPFVVSNKRLSRQKNTFANNGDELKTRQMGSWGKPGTKSSKLSFRLMKAKLK